MYVSHLFSSDCTPAYPVYGRYLSVISDEDDSGSDASLEIIEEDPGGERAVPLDSALQRDSALAVFFGEGTSASDQAELQVM